MYVLTLTGPAPAAKAQLAEHLSAAFLAAGHTLTVLDNGERPLNLAGHLAGVPILRLPPGCVCCTLAGPLLSLVTQLTTTAALLLAATQADPESLSQVLASLHTSGHQVLTVAVLDQPPETTLTHLATRTVAYADVTVWGPQEHTALIERILAMAAL